MNLDFDVDEHRNYYDAYWTGHKQTLNFHEIIRLSEILRAIAKVIETTGNKPLRICDLGCGRGWLANELTKFGSVVAVDLSATGVALANKRWPHIDFRVADITNWRPDERFDLVVSSEVLEHVPDQAGFARTVQHLLRGGGHLVLTTPNRNVKNAWDRGNQGQQLVEKWLTPRELRRLLADAAGILHKTFLFDFGYTGLLRVTSAPKLLRLLDGTGTRPFYDVIRNAMGMGLYQIFLGRYSA